MSARIAQQHFSLYTTKTGSEAHWELDEQNGRGVELMKLQ
jgi:hypothetical protein